MVSALLLTCLLAGPADDLARVGPDGVLRWERSGEEVALFGVNYYPAFYYENQEMTERGLDIRAVIESDLDQFVRLGFDLIRVHCFDREFSTPEGGLVENEHLRLLDHMIAETKRRGIYVALTPIAWWGTPGDIGGFSSHHTMAEMTTNPETWAIQARFLREFVGRVNPETGLRYADDPAIVAFETINEPIPPPETPDEVVTRYIDAQVDAIRSTGCAKPVFYNAWGGRHAALRASRADGSTFNWYPTGLGNGAGLTQDCLGLVDSHPEASDPLLDGTPKMVYEFDCADVPTGELYPAMARSFRTAGIQIAAQFQYDATPCAPHNRYWVTHYLNLAYAPQRALAMAVAGEAFRRLPRGKDFGRHPSADRFDDFRVDHATGLTELAARDAFLHSADTETVPPAPGELTRVAGVGSSPVVRYEGTGAYFLDRLAEGVWRLEVWPDNAWVADPFSGARPSPEVSRVYWRERRMSIGLPDLGSDFVPMMLSGESARPLAPAADGAFLVTPGVWVLVADGREMPRNVASSFPAPAEESLPPVGSLGTVELLAEGQDCSIEAFVAGPADTTAVELAVSGAGATIPLKRVTPYRFAGTIPAALVTGEELRVQLVAWVGGAPLVFPGGRPALSSEAPAAEQTLLRFAREATAPPFGQSEGIEGAVEIAEGSLPERGALRATAARFAAQGEWLGIRIAAEPARGPSEPLGTLVVRGRRLSGRTRAIEVALVMDDGTGYGRVVPLPAEWDDVEIPLSTLSQLWKSGGPALDLTRVREIAVGTGPYTLGGPGEGPYGFAIESIAVRRGLPEWTLPVQRVGAPFVMIEDGAPPYVRFQGQEGFSAYETEGAEPQRGAWGLEAKGFPDGSCLSAAVSISNRLRPVSPLVAGYTTLHLRMRAAAPSTTACEVVVREQDGTAWGTEAPLTGAWTDIRLPLTSLRHFAHWDGTPEGRGGAGDGARAGEIVSLHFTFGAWLYPGKERERHAVEIDYAALEP